MESENVTYLDGYSVVAIENKGVWITDDEGNAWHVGGPYEETDLDNKLATAYRNAVEDR